MYALYAVISCYYGRSLVVNTELQDFYHLSQLLTTPLVAIATRLSSGASNYGVEKKSTLP